MSVHYQICFADNVLIETGTPAMSKRLSIKMFRKWVRYLIDEGHEVKIEYDPSYHTYLAVVKGVA